MSRIAWDMSRFSYMTLTRRSGTAGVRTCSIWLASSQARKLASSQARKLASSQARDHVTMAILLLLIVMGR
jgi:hypothetical protein